MPSTYHVHPDHRDAPAALEICSLAPMREHFPDLASRYPQRATYCGTYYRNGVPVRRFLFASDYRTAMRDSRFLIGHPEHDDPRAPVHPCR